MGRKVTMNKVRHDRMIMDSLEQMRNEGDHCDFTIKAGNKQFRVHCNIISAGSKYFRAMLKHETLESQYGEVELKDVDPECLKCCIDFIYTAEFNFPDGKICELLYASQILQLDEISNAAVEELGRKLAVESFFSTRQIAHLFNIDTILRKCEDFKNANYLAISNQSDFQNESKEEILATLKSKNLIITEKDKLNIVINWVGMKNERKNDLLDLLKEIDLKKVPTDFMESLVEHHPLISNDMILYRILNNAVKEILKMRANAHSNRRESNENIEKPLRMKVVESQVEKKTLILFNCTAERIHTFNPISGDLATLNDARFGQLLHFKAISFNSYIYALCQNKSVYRLNSKERNPGWERVQDMNNRHGMYPPAASANGYLFVIGADCVFDHSRKKMTDIVSSIERFDPTSVEWIQMNDRPQKIANSALVSAGNSIYCIGGREKSGKELKSFWRFHPAYSGWLELAPMRHGKYDCAAVALKQQILVFGGWRNWNSTKEVESYDFLTSQWSMITQMPHIFREIRACKIDNSIFIGSHGENSDKLLKYDAEEGRWERIYPRIHSFFLYDLITV